MELLLQDNKYGEAKFHTRASTARMMFRLILCLIPGLFLIGVGIAMFINPDLLGPPQDAIDQYIPHICLAIGSLIALFVLLVLTRQYSGDIFADGFVVKIGNKTTDYAFADIEGINYYIETTRIGGIIPIPMFTQKHLNISLKGEENTDLSMGAFRFNQHRNFADALIVAHIQYVLKDVSNKDDIKKLNLNFGGGITLSNGKMNFGENKPATAFSNVAFADVSYGELIITGKRIDGQEGIMGVVGVADSINRELLFELIELNKTLAKAPSEVI